MINHFNTNIAVTFSINTAIFVQQLAQFTFLNLANQNHIYDGYAWSYNTLDAYEIIFPYWTRRQLERIVNTAIAQGLILKDNYNKNRYDRTCWYALTQKAMGYYPELITPKNLETLYSSISPNGEMDFTLWCNEFHHTVTTIPTNITTRIISKDIIGDSCESNNLPSHKKVTKSQYGLTELKEDNPHEIDDSMLEDWLKVRKDKKKIVTATCWTRINRTLSLIKKELRIEPSEAFGTMVDASWQTLKLEYFQSKPNGKDKSKPFPIYS